jgi:hypothetical protein
MRRKIAHDPQEIVACFHAFLFRSATNPKRAWGGSVHTLTLHTARHDRAAGACHVTGCGFGAVKL